MGALLSRRKPHLRKLQDPTSTKHPITMSRSIYGPNISNKSLTNGISMKPKQTSQSIAQLLRPCFKVTPSTDAMSKDFRNKVVAALTVTCLPLSIVESNFVNTIIYEAVRVYSLRNTIPTMPSRRTVGRIIDEMAASRNEAIMAKFRSGGVMDGPTIT